MWLLNTSLLEFQDYFDTEYAILSHRWGPQEASLQDLEQILHPKDWSSFFPFQRVKNSFEGHEGLAKIKRCCAVALKDDLKWVWIDTCCIDKKSSAELTEAINSMYTWYEDAAICDAYLADVEMQDNWDLVTQQIRESSWFTRG